MTAVYRGAPVIVLGTRVTPVGAMIAAYLSARRRHVPRLADQGYGERAGRFLLESAARTTDGNPAPGDAIRDALDAGEIGAAVAIADAVIPTLPTHDTTRPAPVAGEIKS